MRAEIVIESKKDYEDYINELISTEFDIDNKLFMFSQLDVFCLELSETTFLEPRRLEENKFVYVYYKC